MQFLHVLAAEKVCEC